MKFWKRPFSAGVLRAVYGYCLCKYLRFRYGNGTHIFLTRGKTGDIYLYFRFLNAFLKENGIKNYILIGDCKNLSAVKALYPDITGRCIETSERVGLALQTAYCLFGGENLRMELSLMWDVDLPVNRCAVRLTNRFTFIDSYYWFLFHLDRRKASVTPAQFRSLDPKLKKTLEGKGYIRGKTVILSPYSCFVRPISPLFWRLLGKDLEKRGYKIFVMLDEKAEENCLGFPGVFFPYRDSAAVLEFAGHFIGLRSGFCDIISGVKCNKVILYPTLPEEFDGSVHRADIDYCGLAAMELADTRTVTECVVPFARNVTDWRPETEDFPMRMKEDRLLIGAILDKFPKAKKN